MRATQAVRVTAFVPPSRNDAGSDALRALVLLLLGVGLSCSSSSSTDLPPPTEHRASAEACSTARAGGTGGGGADGACSTDADCTAGTNGRCVVSQSGPGLREASCTYDGCFADSDCGAGRACACGDVVSGARSVANLCVSAGCRTDADCGVGGFCSPTLSDRAPGIAGFYCHGSADACTRDDECPTTGQHCVYDEMQSHWLCMGFAAFP